MKWHSFWFRKVVAALPLDLTRRLPSQFHQDVQLLLRRFPSSSAKHYRTQHPMESEQWLRPKHKVDSAWPRHCPHQRIPGQARTSWANYSIAQPAYENDLAMGKDQGFRSRDPENALGQRSSTKAISCSNGGSLQVACGRGAKLRGPAASPAWRAWEGRRAYHLSIEMTTKEQWQGPRLTYWDKWCQYKSV